MTTKTSGLAEEGEKLKVNVRKLIALSNSSLETLGLIKFRVNEVVGWDRDGRQTATYDQLLRALRDIQAVLRQTQLPNKRG